MPEVRDVKPVQLVAECETYPTPVMVEGGLKVALSVPPVVTVKPATLGVPPQSYRRVPEPAVGAPFKIREPPQGAVVTAVGAGMTVCGICNEVIAWADTIKKIPATTRIIGLP